MCSVFSFGDDGCLAAAAGAVPGGDTLDNALTSVVSFGDKVTFGGSRWVRHKIGLGDAVDECSAAYNNQAVNVASMVFMFADGEGEAALAKTLASSQDLRALRALVAEAESAGGVTRAEAETLLKWADEYGVTNIART